LGDSNTIVLAAARPTEQLPLIGWRLPSAASSQAPSSGGTRMPKHYQKYAQTESIFRAFQILGLLAVASFILDIASQRVY
jgi:hypothetical protein